MVSKDLRNVNSARKIYKAMRESEIKNLTNFEKRLVGLEFENQILGDNLRPITFERIQEIWKDFEKLGWKINMDPALGVISSLDKNFGSGNVNFSSDSAAGNLERALPPVQNLSEAEKLLKKVHADALKVLRKNKLRMLGTGLQPGIFSSPKKMRTKNTIYLALEKMGASDYFDNAMMMANSAHQAGISLKIEEVIDVTNELTKITGLIVSFFANSCIQGWKLLPWQEWRMICWDLRFFGTEPGFHKLTGFPPKPFKSIADYFKYYWDLPHMILPPTRKGIWCVPIKKINYFRYFSGKESEARSLLGKRTKLKPSVKDINLAMISMWPHAKPHLVIDPKQVTVSDFMENLQKNTLEKYLKGKLLNCYMEYRGAAASPPNEEMALPALILGLVENIDEVKKFTKQYSWNEWRELVYKTSARGMITKINGKSIHGLLKKILEISEKGLNRRKMNEAKYLKVLWKRLANKENPASQSIAAFKKSKKDFLELITYK